MEIPVEKQIRRKLPGEKKDDICQTLMQVVKRNLYKCHDWLQTVFAGLSLQAILEDTESELEQKFKILISEYGADLDISRLPLEVIWLQDFLVTASKVEHDLIMMTKSSAIK